MREKTKAEMELDEILKKLEEAEKEYKDKTQEFNIENVINNDKVAQ